MNLLLVGNPGVEQIGAHLNLAAKGLGIRVEFVNSTKAFAAPSWEKRIHWWLLQHHPPRLRQFSQELMKVYRKFKPDWVLSTGMAPIEAGVLKEMAKGGVTRINYLTDDPWNRAHRAPWFIRALPFYSQIFSTRRANLEQLRNLGCKEALYLPFAYAPAQHFPEAPATLQEKARFDADLVFVGGADRDRVRMVTPAVQEGFKVHLYGGYWQRYRQVQACVKGFADPRTLRLAIGGAKVALCLVRRANRDDHSMRSFEVPAMGGCMLTEDTLVHREIFGEEGEATLYFKTSQELIAKLRWLLSHSTERKRLAEESHRIVTQGRHTYRDRLVSMLGLLS